MRGVLIGLAIVVIIVGIGLFSSIVLSKMTSDDAVSPYLREYNRLTALAAKASRKGHVGEANVYKESAERLAELAELAEYQGEP